MYEYPSQGHYRAIQLLHSFLKQTILDNGGVFLTVAQWKQITCAHYLSWSTLSSGSVVSLPSASTAPTATTGSASGGNPRTNIVKTYLKTVKKDASAFPTLKDF